MTNLKHNLVHVLLVLGVCAIALPAFAAIEVDTSLNAGTEDGIKLETRSMMHVDDDEDEERNEDEVHDEDEDIRIGIGERHEEAEEHMDEMMSAKHDEADDVDEDDEDDREEHRMNDAEDMHGNAVSVHAREVRGWDAQAKAELLAEVKTQAEVNSEQELEHFAQGALLQNEDVESIEAGESEVRVRAHVPAKFLGIVDTTVEQETTITFGDGEHGKVKVKFPWYRFLFKMDDRFNEEAVASSLLPEIDDEVLVKAEASVTPSLQASAIAKVIAYLKVE